MQAYKITGDTSYECRETTDQNEINQLQQSGWYISDVPVIWADKMHVNGVLEDRLQPHPPEPYTPTVEELKSQNNNNIQSQINELEMQGHRANRSITLSILHNQMPAADDVQKLQDIDSQVTALRSQMNK